MTKEERLHQMLLVSTGMDSLLNEALLLAEKYNDPRIAEILPKFGRVILVIAGHGVALMREGIDPQKAFSGYMEEKDVCRGGRKRLSW